ncbi:MAG: tetratricopeptide repeat protein [Chloroflexi bacterium]|nr:MAG: tetratricopeptide repeat protein [Chloroflexota bacterium]
MVIERKDPKYPRQGPSCLLIIFVFFGILVGGFVIQNADEVRDVIIPTATPEPTRSATEYALLANLSIDDGELVEALDYYEQAVALDGTKPQFYIDLINLYIQNGQPEEALSKAADVSVLDPDNEEVWTSYAAAHLANGDRLVDMGDVNGADLEYAQAADMGLKAVNINPQNATALAYIAGGIISQGIPERFNEALKYAQDATSYEPDNPIARYYLATVYTNQGYYPAAREQWQLGIQADPERPDLHMGLAYNFFADGRIPDAILSFKQAIEVDPDNAAAYDGLAYMYLRLGQNPQAEQNALIAIELDPQMARAYGRLGEAYYQQNNYEFAIDALTQAVALYGEPTDLNARFFYFLGSAYLRKGPENCPEAVPYFQQASEVFTYYQEFALEGLTECRRVQLEGG